MVPPGMLCTFTCIYPPRLRLSHTLRRPHPPPPSPPPPSRLCLPTQVGVPDEELAGVDHLPELWANFVAALDAVPARLRELCEA